MNVYSETSSPQPITRELIFRSPLMTRPAVGFLHYFFLESVFSVDEAKAVLESLERLIQMN